MQVININICIRWYVFQDQRFPIQVTSSCEEGLLSHISTHHRMAYYMALCIHGFYLLDQPTADGKYHPQTASVLHVQIFFLSSFPNNIRAT